jgi:hypothetical protein
MKRTPQSRKPRKLFVHLKPRQKDVPVDPNHWSESSKRSYVFHTPPANYEDIEYQCWRCGRSAVYSAAEQKLAFEIRKAHICQRRKLCRGCWLERKRIERGIRDCESRWRAHKPELQRDTGFLRGWLELLEKHSDYGARKNYAGIRMLQRLVEASAQQIVSLCEKC